MNKKLKKKISLIHKKFFKFLALIIIFILFFNTILKTRNNDKNKVNSEDIPPELFEKNILYKIANKIQGKSIICVEELYFINGLIRKYKPKKILEIGVCSGGTSATILNAINDIEGAMLYSCDLEKKNYLNYNLEVGYLVKDYFPEFKNKWKLYTGNTTASFIEQIGKDIDFAFIDTSHVMPGEVLNVLEILPFLKKNAIIAFDDINDHAKEYIYGLDYFYPCNNLLISVLRGKKIIFEQNKKTLFNFKKLGAIILDDNQKKYYYEYFYLLSNNWSYMPNEFEIITIRNLIKKYYDNYYLQMFDKAVEINYKRLKIKGLLKKDYFLYTYPGKKNERKRPFY